jgi:hypothetical protein
LPDVQHLEVDQPAHDDLSEDQELRDLQDQHQDLVERGHRALHLDFATGSGRGG